MSIFRSVSNGSGRLDIRVIGKLTKAPLMWRIRNTVRLGTIVGLIATWFAKFLAYGFHQLAGWSQLSVIVHYPDGRHVDYGVVSRRVVTTAWVNFVIDELQTETSEFGDLKFHDSGVGITAADIADTDIETTDGESRVSGTQIEGASPNIYKSVGTIAYTTTKAITEHVLATQATGGTIIDRHVFSAINVVNGMSIEFTYEWTLSSGG